MAHYPFPMYARQFMDSAKTHYDDLVWEKMNDRYRRIGRDIKMLYEKKIISTLSPRKMTVEDCKEYILYRRSLINPRTQELFTEAEHRHDQSAMKLLFKYPKVRNTAFEDCLMYYPHIKARDIHKRKPPLTDEQYSILKAKCDLVAENCPDDWYAVLPYGIVGFYLGTASRTIEGQFCDVHNIDLDNMTIQLDIVKGIDTYGDPRVVPIHPDFQPIIKAFLILRARLLSERKLENKALFINIRGDGNGRLSDKSIRYHKTKVEKELGFKFDIRKTRRTRCMLMKKKLIRTDVACRVAGNSERVFEKYYGIVENTDAVDIVKDQW
jgi:hypothetical protein